MRASVAAVLAALSPAVIAQVTVTDDLGRAVTLPSPATRIVSLAPHNTENLFAAGAGGRVVGVMLGSDHPPAAADIAVVADYAKINLEAVIALQPDLVVAWKTALLAPQLKKIEALGYPVYYSEPRSFDDIINNIKKFATLAGSVAEPPPALLQKELTQLRATYAGKKTLTAFYQVWRDPLYTLNGDHLVSRALEVCGARNVFAELPVIAPRVSVESVLHADPDLIIADAGADTSPWKKWRALTAARNDAFVSINAEVMARHTPRMILAVRDLCEKIDRHR